MKELKEQDEKIASLIESLEQKTKESLEYASKLNLLELSLNRCESLVQRLQEKEEK